MPPSALKLIWSISSCNFCPRSDVRTCQIKPGKLLSKLSSALDLHESLLDSSEGICTCCLADIDMIIRAVAIRGAMKDYFIDIVQNLQHGYNSTMNNSNYLNGLYQSKSSVNNAATDVVQVSLNTQYTMPAQQDILERPSLLPPSPPSLMVRPPLSRDAMGISEPELCPRSLPAPLDVPPEVTTVPTPTVPPAKKVKERLTRYQCILCDKIAGSKSHCMEHLICHSPVRPFTCSHCMKTYKSRKACREHLIVMHGVEKIEENLQQLVLVDHDGLKQLEDVCTQYRRIYNRGAAKPAFDPLFSPTMLSSLKTEVKEQKSESDGGSAWLYKPSEVLSPLPPPPLLQCLPSTLSEAILSVHKSLPSEAIAPPPSKRTRKGTPHKLINSSMTHDYAAEGFPEPIPDIFIPEDFDDSNDCRNNINYSNKWNSMDNSECDPLGFDTSPDGFYDSKMKQSYFPSFQTCKTEAPLSPMSRQSPYSPNGGLKKAPSPCNICSRSFPTKEKMADHMRSHSEIKQFSCLVCNRFFKYRRGVTNHLKEVHHMTDKSEIGTKVASHEIGCIIPKYRRSKGRRMKMKPEEFHPCDTNISEKVIQDTLSSLADIQTAADSASIPALSSDESSGDAENSTSLPDDQSPRSEELIPNKSTLSEILSSENNRIPVTNSSVTNRASPLRQALSF